MACGNFWQKLENVFFWYGFKVQSLILGASFDRSLPFFQHVLFMGSLIHISNFRSLSQKLQSQENGQDRVQNISVCKVWKVNFCAANFLALLNLLKGKVQAVVKPQLIPSTSTATHCVECFYYIQVLQNCLLQK